MTDASHPVTQRTIETFTRSYFRTIGASIQEEGQKWRVKLPSHVEIDFLEMNEFNLCLEVSEEETDAGEWALSPGSRFAQQLLSEAADQFPVGSIAVTEKQLDGEYSYPVWLQESNAKVESAEFVPYYDRTGLFVLVDIGVETVSEYQMDFLEAVTIDTDSLHPLPRLTDIVLDAMFTPNSTSDTTLGENNDSEAGIDSIAEPLREAQEAALDRVEESLQQTREEATRAAEVEFEEYRQLQEQQLDEVQDEISSLSDRIQELASRIDKVSDQQERVELLQQRNELQSEQQSLEQERDGLLEAKQDGYQEKRNKIFRRHSLEVNTDPVSATLVSYERGELDIQLGYGTHSESIRIPYAVGEGVTDSVSCKNCGQQLNSRNRIQLTSATLGCSSCQ